MKTLTFIVLLCTVCIADAQIFLKKKQVASAGAEGGSAPFVPDLLQTEFEDPSGTPTGWTTDTGSPNYQYTTTVLRGTQSALFNGASAHATFTGQTTVYGFCLFRTSALPGATQTVFGFRDSGGTTLCVCRMDTTGHLSVFSGGSDSTYTTDALSINTKYWIWLTYVSGGTCTVAFSADGSKPTTGTAFTSKTGGTGTAARISFPGSMFTLTDHVEVSTTPIPANP